MAKIVLLILAAAAAWGQPTTPWVRPQEYTLAGKPSFGVSNRTIYIIDCESTSACAVGGGSTVWLFRDSGTAWGAAHPTGGGGGGGGTWGTITGTLSAQTDLQTALDARQPLDADLTALAALSTNGILARTGAATYVPRAITGTANQITVTNGDGVAGAPVLSIPTNPTLPGTTSGTFSGNLAGNADTSTALAAALPNTRLLFGNGSGVPATDQYATYIPVPGSPVAGNLYSRLTVTDGSTISHIANMQAEVRIQRTVTAPSYTATNQFQKVIGGLSDIVVIPSTNWDNVGVQRISAWGTDANILTDATAAQNIFGLYGGGFGAVHSGSGTVNGLAGMNISAYTDGAGAVTTFDGATAYVAAYGTGVVSAMRGYSAYVGNDGTSGGGSITTLTGLDITLARSGPVGTSYSVRTRTNGATVPTTRWDISAETGYTSRFLGRVVVNGSTDDGTTALQVTGTVAATLFSGPLTGNVTGNITGTAPAGSLTGATLAAGVTASSLTSVGTITTGVWTGTDVAVADGGTGSSTASGARTNLGLAIGADVQAWDADLDTLAGLAKTDDALIVANGTTWQVKVLPSCSNATTDKLLYNISTNTFSCGTDQTTGGGSGITSLNALTGATQTFTDDTNVTVVSSGTAHAITWAGNLSIARGGTGTGSTLTGLVRGSASAMTAAELSGDATTSGSNAVTVSRLNGTSLGGLATGLLKNTTSTGVPSIAAFSDVAALTVPNVSNVTAQSTSQSTVTLATAPTAGQYQIKYIVNQNALCTTGNGLVVFAFNWTDAGNARTLTTGPLWLSTAQQTGGYVSGTIPIYVASGDVTYTSTITTCATGTASYDIHAVLERLQ